MTLQERIAEYRADALKAMERVRLLEDQLAVAREEAYEACIALEEAEAQLEAE